MRSRGPQDHAFDDHAAGQRLRGPPNLSLIEAGFDIIVAMGREQMAGHEAVPLDVAESAYVIEQHSVFTLYCHLQPPFCHK
jgi:hypothetical protein